MLYCLFDLDFYRFQTYFSWYIILSVSLVMYIWLHLVYKTEMIGVIIFDLYLFLNFLPFIFLDAELSVFNADHDR